MSTKQNRGANRNRDGHAKRHRARTGLSAQRIRFIDEFMVDRDATNAARRAGYSEMAARANSWKLLRVPAIREEIDRRVAAASAKADVDAVDILRDLKRIAFFDIRQLFRDGKIITDPADLPEEVARGLVNFDIIVLDRDGQHIVKLNPGNRLKALELLGRHLKMFCDRTEVSEHSNVTFTTDFGVDDDGGQGARLSA